MFVRAAHASLTEETDVLLLEALQTGRLIAISRRSQGVAWVKRSNESFCASCQEHDTQRHAPGGRRNVRRRPACARDPAGRHLQPMQAFTEQTTHTRRGRSLSISSDFSVMTLRSRVVCSSASIQIACTRLPSPGASPAQVCTITLILQSIAKTRRQFLMRISPRLGRAWLSDEGVPSEHARSAAPQV